MKPNAIFWFRRDLRLEDNHGLFEVLKNYKNVLPIFIFDPEILDKLPKDDSPRTRSSQIRMG
jgi:deoxyribodipyrimidine photo-lyase